MLHGMSDDGDGEIGKTTLYVTIGGIVCWILLASGILGAIWVAIKGAIAFVVMSVMGLAMLLAVVAMIAALIKMRASLPQDADVELERARERYARENREQWDARLKIDDKCNCRPQFIVAPLGYWILAAFFRK